MRVGELRVRVHHAGQQFLVEAAPVDADAHRLVVLRRGFDHLRELAVVLVALANVAGVDAVLAQRLGTGRVVRQQPVAVVVEVADQRDVDAHAVELFADVGHGRRRLESVDGDAHHLRAGEGQFLDLDRGADRVHRVGVRHRLHAHRRATADRHHARTPAHRHLPGSAHGRGGGLDILVEGGERRDHVVHGVTSCAATSVRASPRCRACTRRAPAAGRGTRPAWRPHCRS